MILLSCACAQPAFGQGWHRSLSSEERRGLREDIDRARHDSGTRRPQRSPEEFRQRREERNRLREAVREGRMSREAAIEQYRGRFGAPYSERRPLSAEEREKLRQDVIEASRNRERR
jgi:hypothetical protein